MEGWQWVDDGYRKFQRLSFEVASRGSACPIRLALQMRADTFRAVGLLAIALLITGNIDAQTPASVEVRLEPSTVQLGPGETAETLFIVRNPGSTSFENIELSSFSSIGVTA